MSVWSHISGVIHLDSSETEDTLLSKYGLYAHNLHGSEGGLNISFTRTQRKSWLSSSENYYNVEGITRVDNMVFQGNLRDFDSEDLENAVFALKDFLNDMKEYVIIRNASFVLECDMDDFYYTVSFVKDRVRTKKVKVKSPYE